MVEIRERKGLLEILSQLGKISETDIERARGVQWETGQKDWRILLQLGMISEEDLRYAQSLYFKLPVWEKKNKGEYLLLEELPYNFLYGNKILPLRLLNGELDVAIANPEDATLVETLWQTARAKLNVKKVNFYVGSEKDIEQGLDELYGTKEEREPDQVVEEARVDEDIEKLRDIASEAPVIRFVHNTIARAIEISASDIHLEMLEKNTRLRYRVDGMLRDFPAPQKSLYPAIISRIKIMAKLNIAEKRLPQDGRIKLSLAGREVDIRVSLIPTIYGEGVVLRILDRSAVCLELNKLGFHEELLRKFRALSRKAEGMILVTGPTGSGKTTTLYSILQEIKSPDINIVTIEDPVEYSLDRISQMQTNSQINLTFASALRNILRHDPDVILIGEIRDLETAEIAVQASLTGHLVFATLHTRNAAGAFTRLQYMGIKSYLLSSSIIGVLAQRLVRILCPICKKVIGGTPSYTYHAERLSKATGLTPLDINKQADNIDRLYRSVGCEECMQSGYSGRTAIGELLVMDDAIRGHVMAQKDSLAIARLAVSKGMKTLWQDGLTKVKAGVTSLEELTRVIDTDDEYIDSTT
ncbi:MAG: GspE/PulE family protein [Candidatus Brocadiales bacterium]